MWLGENLTREAPQEAGITAARALYAVRNAAYDQVRSTAERGAPLLRENCSASAPLEGVYSSCKKLVNTV